MQFCQAIGFVGLKPTITGDVIPITITDNFFRGLSGLESYFINCCGTRKALITNNKYTKRSGYLTRKLELANIDNYHDNSIEDCGTKHFVIYNVNNKNKLNQIVGRHYYEIDESGNRLSDELKTVRDDSVELIGKKIGLRSPITCAGKHTCATCYGKELSAVNKDINTGLSGTLKLTEPLTQRLLSAKHLLTTKTEKVAWGDDFLEAFTANMNAIYFNPNAEVLLSFKKPTAEEYDEDEEMYFIEKISFLISGNKKTIEYESPVKLFINPKLIPEEKNDDEEISIQSKMWEDDEFVFKYPTKNNELTKSLQQILDLIETNDHLGIDNYHDLLNKFDDLLIENSLDYINSVHIEMICARLIVDEETNERPDFTQDILKPYKILRVSNAVLDAPLAVSLSFERLTDQFINLETYEKDGVSMMDSLFN